MFRMTRPVSKFWINFPKIKTNIHNSIIEMHSKKSFFLLIFIIFLTSISVSAQDLFPDGTQVPDWFRDIRPTDIDKLGKKYNFSDYGIKRDSTFIQTKEIQNLIDKVHKEGGGVIIVPKGTYLTASLFFKQGTHLHLEEGAVLKGSDNINDFPVVMTRIEGQTVKYFPALLNADGLNGFTISGEGTVNGNGLNYWKSFWLRREWNPDCTNMDEMRPRLLYVSNSKNVQISGVTFKDSPFWTTHFYKSQFVKLLNVKILAPYEPIKAPSSDAVDIDACENFLIKNSYMSVNDDAVALKGGKGPNADQDPNNGANRNIIIEDNEFGFCHSALTCGSESIHNYNVIFRRATINEASRLLHLKMRPDTPQNYEFIRIEDINGNVKRLIHVKPWTQFFDLQGEKEIKFSKASNITLKNIEMYCETAFDIDPSDQYSLTDFNFENLNITAVNSGIEPTKVIKNLKQKKVNIIQSDSKEKFYPEKDDSDL